jgi:dipeptide/tripeptide permease
VATDAGTVAVAPTARFANGRDLLGQPRGLYFIGATELWERISFHGMQAILVLYMAEQLLLPGHVENIVGFAGLRAAIEGVTGHCPHRHSRSRSSAFTSASFTSCLYSADFSAIECWVDDGLWFSAPFW